MSGPSEPPCDGQGDGGTAGRDPGLQPARTRLAWRRTTLSCTVAAILAAKTALSGGADTLGLLGAALCFLAWLAFLAVAHRRIRDLAMHEVRPPVLTGRAAAVAVACSVALAAFAAALVV
ncbi:DUF202 domain-containing protein [Streptomyces sp. NPDC056656]|uniref:DUF202 domain-containing protein n=1 Tax=Streptomyces sp. NPDC056656 TaxID=3345895 RepID=UPI00368EF263